MSRVHRGSATELEHTDPAMRSFDASLPMALLQAREAAMQHFRPVLAGHDLTEQQWRVLRALSATLAPVDVGALVDATSLLAPSVTRILAKLEERGLIDRATAEEDLRRSVISLSANGVALVGDIAPRSEATYSMIEAEFGRQRLEALMSELHHLATVLDDPRPAP
jgi:homoprotocatechuate degradation regulator HpaR